MKKIAVISLGCPKNLVDTENIVGLLKATGNVVFVDNLKDADIIIVNTCGFIQPAKEESIDEILNAIEEKKESPEKKVVVAGCLYQRYKEELKRELPEVDVFIGVDEIEKSVEKILNQKIAVQKPYLLREILTPPHIAYLKISEGCSNACTYCAIPLIRGKLKSRPIEEAVEEAKRLADKGVKELYVIAQDTTAYLYDKGEKEGLVKLLEKLEKIEGIDWIRLMYTYPSHISDSLIDFVANSEKVLKYFDVPFQHINNKVLASMGRKYTRKDAEVLIDKLRNRIPDITLRTTFIIGFPTEGEREFEELLSFIKDIEFDWAGFFKYSREEDTAAYKLGDIPDEVKESRLNLIEEVQYSIYEKKQMQLLGKEFDLIVDSPSEEMPGFVEARSYKNAYEIDGIVYLKGNFKPGEIVKAEITALASSVDLIGEPINI
ncbi:Ribosomal protein S12 methylthiotransferase rimO [Desulfurobacterium thermolithotrophum DSM 11699]|uniref:Ribosomal protein uS12 methylthiotransferase RimO n=1 Tax=Desulfurobacterium thermolithotrophum (strain DSM 11699 / BSA) TaxID=868864 RepID=F0S2E5_DESTD|nr:30S ribosomal protein S12 methylthiotransferase RimO [Desulfurobacterium thermolithotrophum]ADY74160.1 Ribosomal protein S12 methylthiotransferase rimO [Desulfurobacterium thermolithotrophum DSM 11699]